MGGCYRGSNPEIPAQIQKISKFLKKISKISKILKFERKRETQSIGEKVIGLEISEAKDRIIGQSIGTKHEKSRNPGEKNGNPRNIGRKNGQSRNLVNLKPPPPLSWTEAF